MSESIRSLHRANPRSQAGFAESVGVIAETVTARIARDARPEPRRRSRRIPLAVAFAAAAAAAVAVVTLGSGGEDATAAFRKAAAITAASAERSGLAAVRITHNGEVWAATEIRWHRNDIAVGSHLRVVDGTVYGLEEGAWVELGPPSSIDPDSGTTPGEYLAALRADIGGATLRRITNAMSGLTAETRADGSTVYRGKVPASLIALETVKKGGERIRLLPFGFAAHDEAADPASPLDTSVTVGGDGVIREIAVSWGTWTYTVTYEQLGSAAAVALPEDAAPLDRG